MGSAIRVCCNCSESDCAGLISIPQEFRIFPEALNVILFGNKAVEIYLGEMTS